jgi:hypothetical protein
VGMSMNKTDKNPKTKIPAKINPPKANAVEKVLPFDDGSKKIKKK